MLCFGLAAKGQDGATGIGLRVSPDGAGVVGKHFLNNNLAFETQFNIGGLLSGNEGKSLSFVGLAVYHIPLPDPSWKVYFGGGGHVGSWDHARAVVDEGDGMSTGREMILGIDGIGGVEYRLKTAPVSLSADFKPAINFLSEVDIFPHNLFGVSVKYYLGQ